MATARKFVFFFGKGKAEGRAEQKNLLGGKGANLHEMTRLGIPVPSGFTISTEACVYYTKNKKQYPAGTWKQVEENLKKVEKAMDESLAILATPFWSPCDPGPGSPCPA